MRLTVDATNAGVDLLLKPLQSVTYRPPLSGHNMSRPMGKGIKAVVVSGIVCAAFKTFGSGGQYSTYVGGGRRTYSQKKTTIDNKALFHKLRKFLGFVVVTAFFTLQGTASLYLIYHGCHQCIQLTIQSAVRHEYFVSFIVLVLKLYAFLMKADIFWNFSMGLSASRWLYFTLMLLAFYKREHFWVDDSSNNWLAHYVHKFRVLGLLAPYFQRFSFYNSLTLLDQYLFKTFLFKSFIYLFPFVMNLLYVRDFLYHVFLMGFLLMVLYQFVRCCFIFVTFFFYSIACYYNCFDKNYQSNFYQFRNVIIRLNMVYALLCVILVTLWLLYLNNDLDKMTVVNEYLGTLTALQVFLVFTYFIVYAFLKCVTFLVVTLFLWGAGI